MLKNDGMGTLKLPDRGTLVPFKWQKTPQGATAYLEKLPEGLTETNLFFRFGNNPNEMLVKDSHNETKWTRDDGEKRKAIEKLFQLSGIDKYITQQNSLLLASLKASRTNVSEESWRKLEQTLELRAAQDEIIATYDIYYTLEELKALNAFYSSPLGKKELTTRPLLFQHVIYILQGRIDKLGAATQEFEKKKN